jgi:Putative metallopeptidase
MKRVSHDRLAGTHVLQIHRNEVMSMKPIVSGAALASAMLCAAASTPALAQFPSDLRNPQIEIAYVEPSDAAYRPIYERLKKRQVLEELQAFLAPLKLPKKLQVRTTQCGATSAPYKPGGPVTVCYEYIAMIERAAPETWVPIGRVAFVRQYAIAGGFIHVMLHEVALATFDILEIPVLGLEEHAADRVAGYIMLQFGKEVAYKTLIGTAWFLAQTSYTGMGEFSGAHGRDLDAQRFYNILCVAYGGDPTYFAFLKTELKNREANCQGEYQQLRYSFNKTFLPHIDRELLAKVRTAQWLKADDGK